MLIPIHYCANIKNFTGVIHIGAHNAEELEFYLENKLDEVIWIEANPSMWESIENRIKKFPKMKLGKFGAASKNATSFLNEAGISSSILPLGTAKVRYPGIDYASKVKIELKEYDSWAKDNNIKLEDFNFLNIDIQGYELEALKGMKEQLRFIDYIYSEINFEAVYENCVLINELDCFLKGFGFQRVATEKTKYGWGEALYAKKQCKRIKARFFMYKLKSFIKLKGKSIVHGYR